MALQPSRAVSGCLHCRSGIAQRFAAAFLPQLAPVVLQRLPTANSSRRRIWTSAPLRVHDAGSNTTTPAPLAPSEATPKPLPPKSESSSARTDVAPSPAEEPEQPWYLQESAPQHRLDESDPYSTAVLRPRPPVLPDLPLNSPALLAPLLAYLSAESGLDELTVLDLRVLDSPPPALGSNLIMVLGTARSERHLHVAAGRLVRHLRHKYRLTRGVYAHGLMGPGELKIKLRRRARKAKLMGSDAASVQDDGITTGWICVNLGTVPDHLGKEVDGQADEAEELEADGPSEGATFGADGRMTGFGPTGPEGTTLVVQMLTEAKRADLDLESLWTRTLERHHRDMAQRDAAVSDLLAGEPPETLVSDTGQLMTPEQAAREARKGRKAKVDRSGREVPGQKHRFSTSARWGALATMSLGRSRSSHGVEAALPRTEHQFRPATEGSAWAAAKVELILSSPAEKLRLAQLLEAHLAAMSDADAADALRLSDEFLPRFSALDDSSPLLTPSSVPSTPFQRLCAIALDVPTTTTATTTTPLSSSAALSPPLVPHHTFPLRLLMHARARALRLRGYGLPTLAALVDELELSASHALPRATLLLLLRAALLGASARPARLDAKRTLAARVLRIAADRGGDGGGVLATDVEVALREAAVLPMLLPINSGADVAAAEQWRGHAAMTSAQWHLHDALVALLRGASFGGEADVARCCPTPAEIVRLLALYAAVGSGGGTAGQHATAVATTRRPGLARNARFWDAFRLPPRHGLPGRGAEVWAAMWGHVAVEGSAATATAALRDWWGEMAREARDRDAAALDDDYGGGGADHSAQQHRRRRRRRFFTHPPLAAALQRCVALADPEAGRWVAAFDALATSGRGGEPAEARLLRKRQRQAFAAALAAREGARYVLALRREVAMEERAWAGDEY